MNARKVQKFYLSQRRFENEYLNSINLSTAKNS